MKKHDDNILTNLAVVVAIVADWVVQTAAGQLGVDFGGFFFFGLLVTIWLILNECISILENISEIGVPLPAFLVALIQKLKKAAEEKGEEGQRPLYSRFYLPGLCRDRRRFVRRE